MTSGFRVIGAGASSNGSRFYRRSVSTRLAVTVMRGTKFKPEAVAELALRHLVGAMHPEPLVDLWRMVFYQAIKDAQRNEDYRDWEWLRLDNMDFQQVCELAGYDPAWILRKVEPLLTELWMPSADRSSHREAA